MLVNFVSGIRARRRVARGSNTSKTPSECSARASFALQTKLNWSEIGAGRRACSVPAHQLRISQTGKQPRAVHPHGKEQVAARPHRAERRLRARGRQVRMDLVHDPKVSLAIEARRGWQRAAHEKVAAPSGLLGRAARAADPGLRRTGGLEHAA